MADVAVLVCACGMRLKAAGAVPGRVGKCPSCGGLLRVPEAGIPLLVHPAPTPDPAAPPSSGDGYSPTLAESTTTYAASRRKRATDRRAGILTTKWNGIFKPLIGPETRLRDSLLYPLRGETGVALLVLMPPVFWVSSIPLLSVIVAWGSGGGNVATQFAATLALVPTGFLFFLLGGYTLLYLGRVVVTSAVGEVHHPRWPDWDAAEMFRGIGRWFWALLLGGILGGLPAVAYWMYCGDIDVFDGIIIGELVAMGSLYGQVALLASILHEDPLGTHPVTVFRAIRRVGRGWIAPSLVVGSHLGLALAGLMVAIDVRDPLLGALAYWAYWVLVLYGAMVALRVLGLTYHRHARALNWFRERPRWGG